MSYLRYFHCYSLPVFSCPDALRAAKLHIINKHSCYSIATKWVLVSYVFRTLLSCMTICIAVGHIMVCLEMFIFIVYLRRITFIDAVFVAISIRIFYLGCMWQENNCIIIYEAITKVTCSSIVGCISLIFVPVEVFETILDPKTLTSRILFVVGCLTFFGTLLSLLSFLFHRLTGNLRQSFVGPWHFLGTSYKCFTSLKSRE